MFNQTQGDDVTGVMDFTEFTEFTEFALPTDFPYPEAPLSVTLDDINEPNLNDPQDSFSDNSFSNDLEILTIPEMTDDFFAHQDDFFQKKQADGYRESSFMNRKFAECLVTDELFAIALVTYRDAIVNLLKINREQKSLDDLFKLSDIKKRFIETLNKLVNQSQHQDNKATARENSFCRKLSLAGQDEGHHLLDNNQFAYAIDAYIDAFVTLLKITPKQRSLEDWLNLSVLKKDIKETLSKLVIQSQHQNNKPTEMNSISVLESPVLPNVSNMPLNSKQSLPKSPARLFRPVTPSGQNDDRSRKRKRNVETREDIDSPVKKKRKISPPDNTKKHDLLIAPNLFDLFDIKPSF